MYGDSLKDYVVGIIVIDPEHGHTYAKVHNKTFDDALMADNDFKQTVFEDLLKLAAENKFNSLEKPKQLTLLKDPFTIESDLLTPTMKLKRNIAKKHFQETLDAMYAAPPMTAAKK
jgi:long-chain acyl-CoA synthetase